MLAMVMLPLGQLLKLSSLPARLGTICHQFRNPAFGSARVTRYLYRGRDATCLSHWFTLSAAIPATRMAAPTAMSLFGSASSRSFFVTKGTQAYRTAQKSQLRTERIAGLSPAAYPNSARTTLPL